MNLNSLPSGGKQDEPAGCAPRLQRSRGHGIVRAGLSGGATRLQTCYQEGSASIRLPDTYGGKALEAVLVNTSGGLTGGDSLAWEASCGPGAAMSVTSAAYEKIYRSAHGGAEVRVTLKAGAGARLAWIPQETLFYDGGHVRRRLEADLAPDAVLLAVESVLLGRLARGESVETGSMRESWRIRRDGRLLHAEEILIGSGPASSAGRAIALGGGAACATLLLAGPGAADRIAMVRECLGDGGGTAGASAWQIGDDGKLLARIVADDGYGLRQTLVPLLDLLMKQAGFAGGLPRIWSN